MTTAIRKVVISAFGDVSNLDIVESTIEPPAARQVQVSVIYAGFNGGDVGMRLGVYPGQNQPPLTPGYCLVGTVVGLGPNCVSNLTTGDVVASLTVHDSQAERVNLPEKYAIKVPPGVDLQQATALVLDWTTASGMVKHVAKVRAGQRVFVHGCSGAVGYGVMKLCQAQGAEVYGTASEKNHPFIREQGGEPLLYTNKDWISTMQEIGGVDAVFDALGFESWDESWSILNSTGILVGYGGNLYKLNDEESARERSMTWALVRLYLKNVSLGWKRARFFLISKDQTSFVQDLQDLFRLSAEGKIIVPIKKVWQLDEIRDAHRSWGSGSGVGSLLIQVSRV